MLNDDQKGIFIPDYNDPKVYNLWIKRIVKKSVGTKSSFLVPLFTLDDKYIGTIGIDYVTKKKKLTKDQWEHFQIKFMVESFDIYQNIYQNNHQKIWISRFFFVYLLCK